jgi:hypothetical protein
MAAQDDDLIERLRAALGGGPPLALAVLFGSTARGAMHTGSDVDVAILPEDPALSLSAELELQAALEAAARRRVDLVRLDTDDVLLRWEIARAGVPLFECDPGAFARFTAGAALAWLDFEPVFSRARRTYLERLAESR